ncbi:MAG: hypothetical protein KA220_00820 [Phenylobacterium sp.]|nr:hypothetical protein [Phenylobacterium sp.]MBP8247590.1 hypothetical protein [Phenylobacterium sp.]
MRFVRPLSLIVLAAILATGALSGLVFHEVSRASFIAQPFAILGTAAVATACGWMTEAGWVRWFAYVLTVALGAALGAAVSLLSGTADTMLFGVGYGITCAAAWVLLDLVTPGRLGSAS